MRSVDGKEFRTKESPLAQQKANTSSRTKSAKIDDPYPTSTYDTRRAADAGKTAEVSSYSDTRPFLAQRQESEVVERARPAPDDRASARAAEQKQVAREGAVRASAMQPDEAFRFLREGTAQIISEDELRAKLALGRPLRDQAGRRSHQPGPASGTLAGAAEDASVPGSRA